MKETRMSLFRRDPDSNLGDELRRSRPKPHDDLVQGLAARIERQIPSRTALRVRIGAAVALTVAFSAVAAAVGGVGYAASATSHAVKAVEHVVTPTKPSGPSRFAFAPKGDRHEGNGSVRHDNGHGNGNANGNGNSNGNDDHGNGNGNGGDDNGNGDDGHGGPSDHQYKKVHMCHGHHPGDDIEVSV